MRELGLAERVDTSVSSRKPESLFLRSDSPRMWRAGAGELGSCLGSSRTDEAEVESCDDDDDKAEDEEAERERERAGRPKAAADVAKLESPLSDADGLLELRKAVMPKKLGVLRPVGVGLAVSGALSGAATTVEEGASSALAVVTAVAGSTTSSPDEASLDELMEMRVSNAYEAERKGSRTASKGHAPFAVLRGHLDLVRHVLQPRLVGRQVLGVMAAKQAK